MKQPLPKKNNEKCIQDLVISDIKERKKTGKKKYGTVLQSFNGRNSVQDLFEELLDAVQYCKQIILEKEEIIKILKDYYIEDIDNKIFSGKAETLLKKLGEIK